MWKRYKHCNILQVSYRPNYKSHIVCMRTRVYSHHVSINTWSITWPCVHQLTTTNDILTYHDVHQLNSNKQHSQTTHHNSEGNFKKKGTLKVEGGHTNVRTRTLGSSCSLGECHIPLHLAIQHLSLLFKEGWMFPKAKTFIPVWVNMWAGFFYTLNWWTKPRHSTPWVIDMPAATH